MSRKYKCAEKRVIVKYSNRKLYDTQESKYINLKDIGEMLMETFVVLEHETSKDVTDEIILDTVTVYLKENPETFKHIVKDHLLRDIGWPLPKL
jgi:polyhydroxyalkanoate synthesis regulator protein